MLQPLTIGWIFGIFYEVDILGLGEAKRYVVCIRYHDDGSFWY